MLHPGAARVANVYLAQADRLLPGRISAFYVVGSAALGEYRDGRSDVDFVAVIEGGLTTRELRRLRVLHVLGGARSASFAAVHGRSPLTGTCNGVFIRDTDLTRPVRQIEPIASHTAHTFAIGRAGSDVSPVAWKVLAEHGIPIRGPAPSALQLDPEPDALREWNLDNLESYWRPWATAVAQSPGARFRLRPRWMTAWGVLGVARLHHTIATGAVVSKEAAGCYALQIFPEPWDSLIGDALAYRRKDAVPRPRMSPAAKGRLTAEFVFHVIESAGHIAHR